jgi:hypothetical protein
MERRRPQRNDLEKNEFHQRERLKKKNMHLQKRGMQLFKQSFKYIERQHPNLSKEEVVFRPTALVLHMYNNLSQLLIKL